MTRLTLWAMLVLIVFIPGIQTLFPGSATAMLAVFAVVAVLAGLGALQTTPIGTERIDPTRLRGFWLGLALVGVMAAASLRSYLYSPSPEIRYVSLATIPYIFMSVFAVWAIQRVSAGSRVKMDPFKATYYVLWWYCFSNLVLWALGVKNTTYIGVVEDEAQLLSLMGISMKRVLFPMAWGVNNFAVVAGFVLVVSVVRMMKSPHKLAATLMASVPLLCCLLTDSRGALLMGAVASLGAVLAPRWSGRAVFVFWVLGAGIVLFQDFSAALTFGGRQGATSFTGRELIWAAGVAEFLIPQPVHIFGYGLVGQFESGAYLLYEALFRGYVDTPELISLHNTYLQTLMDTGYVGLMLLLMFLIYAIRGLGRNAAVSADWPPVAALAALFFLAMNGLTEVTITIYHPWGTLLLVVLAFSLRDGKRVETK
jgi:hypothetical protein